MATVIFTPEEIATFPVGPQGPVGPVGPQGPAGSGGGSSSNIFIDLSTKGVVGDGTTDDAPALQAAINAAPDWSTLIIPAGFRVRINSTININGRQGLRIMGVGSHGESSGVSSGASRLVWGGASTTATMIVMDGTRDCTFENFSIGGTGAAVGTAIDVQETGAHAPVISTFNRFRGLYVHDCNIAGIQVGQTSIGNCEAMFFENCAFDGSNVANAMAINIQSGNSFAHGIVHCIFSNWGKGINNQGGSFYISGGTLFNSNDIDIYSAGSDPIDISCIRTENSNQFFKGGGGSITIRNCAFAAPGTPADSWIDVSGSGSGTALFLYSNLFDSNTSAVPPFKANDGCLTSIGNRYSYATTGALMASAFAGGGYVSMGDALPDGPAGSRKSYNSNLSPFLPSMTFPLVHPAFPGTGEMWIEFTGTTPNRQLRLAVRDGATTYYQNIGAAH